MQVEGLKTFQIPAREEITKEMIYKPMPKSKAEHKFLYPVGLRYLTKIDVNLITQGEGPYLWITFAILSLIASVIMITAGSGLWVPLVIVGMVAFNLNLIHKLRRTVPFAKKRYIYKEATPRLKPLQRYISYLPDSEQETEAERVVNLYAEYKRLFKQTEYMAHSVEMHKDSAEYAEYKKRLDEWINHTNQIGHECEKLYYNPNVILEPNTSLLSTPKIHTLPM